MRELRMLLALAALLASGGVIAQSLGSVLAAGQEHSLLIGADGSIWSFGEGDNGKLGRASSDRDNTPARVDVPFGTRFVAVAGGFEHSLAVDRAGRLWAWGKNQDGGLGHPVHSGAVIATPTLIPVVGTDAEGVRFVQVAAGRETSLALDASGRLWSWGGWYGRGLAPRHRGGSRHLLRPIEFPEPARIVRSSVSWDHAAALDDQGSVWMWGHNTYGELGIGPADENGLFESTLTPTEVVHPSGLAFTSVATTLDYTVALDAEGVAWSWGRQEFGRLGTGQPDDAPVPTRVAMPYEVRFVSFTLGGQHAIALDEDGHAWAWGWGNRGQLGTPVAEPAATLLRVIMPPGVRFTAVAAGYAHSLALDGSGRLWGWGRNWFGELGLPVEDWVPTPALVGAF